MWTNIVILTYSFTYNKRGKKKQCTATIWIVKYLRKKWKNLIASSPWWATIVAKCVKIPLSSVIVDSTLCKADARFWAYSSCRGTTCCTKDISICWDGVFSTANLRLYQWWQQIYHIWPFKLENIQILSITKKLKQFIPKT
jgi:hypothetical protein